eukprot:m.174042 g.174042  ORF g.174042 m.174042 type:complete len:314 (+) comp39100_c0_seq21:311-1252(+)
MAGCEFDNIYKLGNCSFCGCERKKGQLISSCGYRTVVDNVDISCGYRHWTQGLSHGRARADMLISSVHTVCACATLRLDMLVCVECGAPCTESCAFKRFTRGAIQLLRCTKCEAVVDKYVEYDFVMLLLDVLLHKVQAFRHFLSNRQIQVSSHLKFWAVSVLCTAYVRYLPLKVHQKPSALGKYFFPNMTSPIPEFDFCVAVSLTMLEILSFVLMILFLTRNLQKTHLSFTWVSWFLLSSYGRLLAIPVALWAKEAPAVLFWLPALLTFTSTIQTIQVTFMVTFLRSVVIGLLAVFSEQALSWIMQKSILNNH